MTFLGHEAQHFADLSRFQGLAGWELEYRAKLVELAQLDQTRERVLMKFIEDQKDDPASPHSYANLRVLSTMVERLGLESTAELSTVEVDQLNGAARAALVADTRRLQETHSR